MKKILSLVLGITLLLNTCLGSAVYAITNSDFINDNNINNINYFAEMFERENEILLESTLDGIKYTTKVIVDNDKYRIVGTKCFNEISIAVLNKQTEKLNIYTKKISSGNQLLRNNDTFFKSNTVDFSRISDNLLAKAGDTINTYNCNYLTYKYKERWPTGPASDINVKFTLTKSGGSCTTAYVVKTSDTYKYSKKFESNIKNADAYMEGGYKAGLGFIPGVGLSNAMIAIVEVAKTYTVTSMLSALSACAQLIPIWGELLSVSDMAGQFILANASCISANSNYKNVYNLCN